MKGKIDKDGFLKLHRGNKLKQQDCKDNPDERWCGDWCPQFGEPRAIRPGSEVFLDICQERTLVFGEGDFVDELNKEEESK